MKIKLIVLISISIITSFPTEVEGQEYYNLGTKALMNSQYAMADSLLTRSINSFGPPDAFYNRAIARFYLADSISACADLYIPAYFLEDLKAISLYNDLCCSKVDTTYYDKKLNISDKNNYKYYAITLYSKHDSINKGTLNRKNANLALMTFDMGLIYLDDYTIIRTDVIGHYYLIDERRIYYWISTDIPNLINLNELADYRKRAKVFLNSKYGYIKSDINTEDLEVRVKFIVNKEGMIENVRYTDTYPKIHLTNVQQTDFEKDIIDMVYKLPKFKTAKLAGEKIDFERNLIIEY